jgi:hypothetical protein
MSAASIAVVTARAADGDAKRIGVLFMVGSACFAVASLPAASELSVPAVGITYFIGSIFFTTAAFEQLRTARGDWRETWSAGIQFAGTLFFNLSTFAGMANSLETGAKELLVWSPDAFGSVCFLASSAIAAVAAWAHPGVIRRSSVLNLVGSVAFGISAIAGFIVPDTDDLLDASLASSATLIGALCFFRAARLLVHPPAWIARRSAAA